jgi:adenine-specific DNA-methyltransferase
MDKMKMETPDLTQENVEKLLALFPECATEVKQHGKVTRGVNFDVLQQLLTPYKIEGEEAYEFTWVGKKAAFVEANRPIRKTLRPVPEKSKDWQKTENLYIEGDNLEALKLLREAYLGQVKMIYIDPPYNTGNDFIYNDSFKMSKEELAEGMGLFDEEGNKQFTENSVTNPRFHSDWCSMIYSRLRLVKNLLSEDGAIFISIDDNEQENLKKICDEVFGASNFIAQLIWERAFAPKNDARFISNSHDYVLMYAKSINSFTIGRLPRTKEADARYKNPDNDPRGPWQSDNLTVKTYSPSGDYPITCPSGRIVEPPAGRCWSLSAKAFAERLQDNRIWFGSDGNGVPRIKRFLNELNHAGMAPTSLLFYKEVGHSQEGAQEVAKLMEGAYFNGPKPLRLLRRLLTLANLNKESLVLDFFSGSATTAHAVMQMNAEDGGHRRFIMVQLPEKTDEKSEAKKAGFDTICDIGEERIRRAGEKIKAESPLTTKELDTGFRVFRVDDSNMKDVYYSADEVSQDALDGMISNIKEDRSALDLLFGCLVDWGIPLSKKCTSETVDGHTIYDYGEGDLLACFDTDISESVIEAMARKKPLRAVFRDGCFSGSQDKINVFEIFKMLSPDTTIRVL